MLKLLQNEWMKLWNKKSTWVMTILLVVILVAAMGMIDWLNTSESMPAEDWRTNTEASLSYNETMAANPLISESEQAYYEGVAAVERYRLEQNVPPYEYMSLQQQVLDSYMMMPLVSLFTVVAAAGIIASEFSQGTIKMLLTRPIRRWKILTAKYITALLFGLLLAVLMVAVSAIASLLFFGYSDGTYVRWTGSETVESPYYIEGLKLAALSFASVWMISTFAFMLGTVFRSSSLAIGLSIFLLFVGGQGAYFLSRYEIAKYYWFTHMNLAQYQTGFMPVPDITLGFSFFVLMLYFLLFMIITFVIFTKRDVTA